MEYVKVGGAVVVALFAVFWIVFSFQVLTHSGSEPLKVGTNLNIIAGGLATAVGTSTAAWLGIEIKKIQDQNRDLDAGAQPGWGKQLLTVLTRADVVSISCWTYLVIAVIVLLLGVFKQDTAPTCTRPSCCPGSDGYLGPSQPKRRQVTRESARFHRQASPPASKWSRCQAAYRNFPAYKVAVALAS